MPPAYHFCIYIPYYLCYLSMKNDCPTSLSIIIKLTILLLLLENRRKKLVRNLLFKRVFTFGKIFVCLNSSSLFSKAKSNYRGYNQKSSSPIFLFIFFIDNSNANISLHTLSCPKWKFEQLKVYKELSMKK